MTREELQKRVNARKDEIENQRIDLNDFKDKVTSFVNDIKGRSTIYALIKNLKIWKELEEIIK